MLGFLRVLARLTRLRKPRRPVRDAALGVGVGLVIGAGGTLRPDWAGWLLLLYFALAQALAFADNDIFFTFADLRRLGFRDRTPSYRVAYVTHYLARDKTVANVIALGLACGILVATGRGWLGLWLLVAYAVNLCLLPSHIYLAPRLSSRGRTAYVGGLFVGWIALLVPLLLSPLPPEAWLPVAAPATALAGAVQLLAVDAAADRLSNNGLASFGERGYLAWLAPVSPFLFKDLLLYSGMIAERLVMALALFALLAVGSPRESLPALALFALGTDNVLLGRRERQYRLLADDNLFGAALRADAAFLRRRKLLTLSMDLPIKAMVIVAVLTGTGQLRPDLLAAIGCVLVAGGVVDAHVPYLSGRLGATVRHGVKYALAVVFAAVTLLGQPLAFVVLAAAVVAATYLPSLVATYWPKVSSHPGAGVLLARDAGIPDLPVRQLTRA